MRVTPSCLVLAGDPPRHLSIDVNKGKVPPRHLSIDVKNAKVQMMGGHSLYTSCFGADWHRLHTL